ncbi:MAG TPA: hypothetical protein ENJ35_04330 [Gammaproteobacteria bacterium]|nr:hypothetical protein [Gammaproteobacteria bacterium]
MSNTDNEPYEVTFDEVVARTSAAILFDFGMRKIWIPKSAISDHSDELMSNKPFEGGGSIWIPEWLVIQEGLE